MSLRSRVPGTEEVLIREFRAGDETAFRMLNEQWIKRFFRVEAKDESALADPQKTIIERGGLILIATIGGQSVGCCALLRMRRNANSRWRRWLLSLSIRVRALAAVCCARRLKRRGGYGRADFT